MSLSALLAAGPELPRKGPRCGVGITLDALPMDERSALQSMLDEKAWTGSRISAALATQDIRVSGQTVNRHRRAECYCDVIR